MTDRLVGELARAGERAHPTPDRRSPQPGAGCAACSSSRDPPRRPRRGSRASRAVNVCSASARTAATRACARASRAAALARFTDPFWVREKSRCRCATFRRASRSARMPASSATTVRSAVATTAETLTPRSTPMVGPAGAIRRSTGVRISRSKQTVAYQRPSECRVTVMFSNRARPRRTSRRRSACARQGAAIFTQPYFASRTRPASRRSPSATVNRARSRCRDLNRGNRRCPVRNAAVRLSCGPDAVPERPGRVLSGPRAPRPASRRSTSSRA